MSIPIVQPRTVGTLLLQLKKLLDSGEIKSSTPLIYASTPLIYASDDEGNNYAYTYLTPDIAIFNEVTHEYIDVGEYTGSHYDEIKNAYKMMLINTGRYSGHNLDEVRDGRDEFIIQYIAETIAPPQVLTLCLN